MSAWTFDSVPDQTGRVVIVTGSNTGIGFEAAKMFALRGARVTLACRDTRKADDAAQRIRAEHPAAALEVSALDLADLDAVKAFAQTFAASHDRLDLLINNAGVMVPPASKTKQGFELQFGTNHLGHFALTAALLPRLCRTEGSRVVAVSSGVHHVGRIDFDDLQFERRGYNAWAAYSQSKLANLLFVAELQRRLSAAGARTVVTAAHPGYTLTDLQRTATAARLFGRLVAMRPHEGALPTMRAATDPDARGGDYYGPAHLFEMRGPPVRAKINARARDEAVAARLWAVSETLTGVRVEVPQG